MDGKLKKLKMYSIVYFLLGCVCAVSMLLGVVRGKFNALPLVEGGFFNEAFATVFVGLEFIVSAMVVLAYFCLGVKGYEYGIDEGYGTIHISVIKAMTPLLLIQLIIKIIAFFAGYADIITLIATVIGIIMIADYTKCAREALNG